MYLTWPVVHAPLLILKSHGQLLDLRQIRTVRIFRLEIGQRSEDLVIRLRGEGQLIARPLRGHDLLVRDFVVLLLFHIRDISLLDQALVGDGGGDGDVDGERGIGFHPDGAGNFFAGLERDRICP